MLVVLAAAWCATAFGAVTVTPATPTSINTVTLRVENTFGAQANVTSASITQIGNAFIINQSVVIACALPSNPPVVSQFQVGPLAAGSYTVTAHITFTNVLPGPTCGAPITQTVSFDVHPAAEVPALGETALVMLGVLLAASGVVALGLGSELKG